MRPRYTTCVIFILFSFVTFSTCQSQVNGAVKGSETHYIPSPEILARIHDQTTRSSAATAQGDAALTAGKYEHAVGLYQKALDIAWDDRALLGLAEAYERLNRQNDALRTYHQLAHPKPLHFGSIGADPTTRMRYVLLLLKNDRWSEALEEYKAALNPKNPTLSSYFLKSSSEFSPERPDWARLESMAHLLLGTVRPGHKEIDREEFVTHLKRAAQLQPADPTVRLYLADGLRNADHTAEAKREYRTAEILAANDPEVKALAHSRYVETVVKAEAANDTAGKKK